MPRTSFLLMAILMCSYALHATTTTIDFEGLPDGRLTNQIPGLYFTNADVVTPSPLIPYPPHSGVNSITEYGGYGVYPLMEIAFSTPVSSVSAYFDYSAPVTMLAYDQYYDPLGSATSKYSSNLPFLLEPLPGNVNSPNEKIEIDAPAGIQRLQIFTPYTDVRGGFNLDDLTFTTAVPEIDPDSSVGALALLAGGLLIFRGNRNKPA